MENPRTPSVSVVILSKDEPELNKSLSLLRPQIEAIGGECIVVDASRQRLDWIRREQFWVTWIDYEGPFWRSSTIPQQRNIGVRACQAPIIAFCDAGGEPSEKWLDTLCAPLLSGREQFVAGPITSIRSDVFTVVNPGTDGSTIDSPATANVAFTRSIFDKVGGFDERFLYGSDVDFSWRCAAAGVDCRIVEAAEMRMDWGSASQSRKRSWRYGIAWVRLFRLHPERRLAAIKERPERLAYPLWILGAIATLPLIFFRRWRLVPLAWWGLLGVFFARNRRHPEPLKVVQDHLIGGAGELGEVLRASLAELGPVAFVPYDQSPYLHLLADELDAQGIKVAQITEPTKSHTLNVLLAPISLVLARIRGVRVIHLHWTYWFVPAALAKLPRGRQLLRHWFALWLWVLRRLDLKLVWTIHNMLPHEQTFDNDHWVLSMLLDAADQLVSFSDLGAGEQAPDEVPRAVVIEHGPMALPTPSKERSALREELDVGDEQTLFSLVGKIRPYKGAPYLIESAGVLGESVSVRIAGAVEPGYMGELEAHLKAARMRGADVRVDGRHLSEQEIADVLDASDFCVFPFASVTNSASVLLALGAGVPVIVPDLPGLATLPDSCAIRYPATKGVSGLSVAMAQAAGLSADEHERMAQAGRAFAHRVEWDEVARKYIDVYRAVCAKRP